MSPAPITPIALRAASSITAIADVARVEQELVGLVPPGFTYEFHVTSRVVEEVELSLKPESVALGAFGAIAALVCLVLGLQAISRQLRRETRTARSARPRSRSSGHGWRRADRRPRRSDPRLAARRSPWRSGCRRSAPLGPVRPVYPDTGIAFDWTVLGVGLAVLVVGLGAAAVALSYRGAPHLVARGAQGATRRSSVSPWRRSGGDAGGRCDGGAFRPRTGARPHRGAGALGVVGHGARRRHGGGHPHLRQQPEHPRLASPLCTGGTGTTRSTRATTSRRKH